MNPIPPIAALVGLSLVALPFPSIAEETPPASSDLLKNGTLETDADADGWPDHWAKVKTGGTWETENDNHFLRLTSSQPGSTVMLYQEIPIPAGTTMLELKWRQRVANLKAGAQAWFDARIMMDFMDASRAKVSPSPSAPYVRKDTGGWQEKSMRITVPAGAVTLKFMPALFQVETGTFDLDDISLTVAKPAGE